MGTRRGGYSLRWPGACRRKAASLRPRAQTQRARPRMGPGREGLVQGPQHGHSFWTESYTYSQLSEHKANVAQTRTMSISSDAELAPTQRKSRLSHLCPHPSPLKGHPKNKAQRGKTSYGKPVSRHSLHPDISRGLPSPAPSAPGRRPWTSSGPSRTPGRGWHPGGPQAAVVPCPSPCGAAPTPRAFRLCLPTCVPRPLSPLPTLVSRGQGATDQAA